MGHPALEVTEGTDHLQGRGHHRGRPRRALARGPLHGLPVPGRDPRRHRRQVPADGRSTPTARRAARSRDQAQGLPQDRRGGDGADEHPAASSPARYLNDGFSGGEKKRMEILQLALLQPADRGPRRDRLRPRHRRAATSSPRASTRSPDPDMGVLIITHYQRILHLVKPDRVTSCSTGGSSRRAARSSSTQLEDEGLRLDQGGGRRRGRLARDGRRDARPARHRADPRTSSRSCARGPRQPLAYLDSARDAQKPRVVIEAIDDQLARAQRQRPPRLLHALRRGDRRSTRAPARRSPRSPAPTPARDDLRPQRDRGDQPRRLRLGRAPTSAPATAIVLTEMEHHSNIVPWQQLAEQAGRRARLGRGRRRGPARPRRSSTRSCSSGRAKLVAVAHVSNVLGTINPIAEIVAPRPRRRRAGRSSTARRRCRRCRVDVAALGADFYA